MGAVHRLHSCATGPSVPNGQVGLRVEEVGGVDFDGDFDRLVHGVAVFGLDIVDYPVTNAQLAQGDISKPRGATACDGLKDLPESIRATWPDATVQTCVVRMVRNSLRYASKKRSAGTP